MAGKLTKHCSNCTTAVFTLQELIVADIQPFNYPPPFTSVLLTQCGPSWEFWKQSIYQVILAIALYLAPMILMILTYTHIALVLWMQEIPGDSIQGKERESFSGCW